jgi:hypothetical protein
MADEKTSLADNIRVLLAEGFDSKYIAAKLDTTTRYIGWVIWTDKNRSRRQTWEVKYRNKRYQNPSVRSRVLTGNKLRRRKAKAKAKEEGVT